MKTQINFSVTKAGASYNGVIFRRPKLKTETVLRHAAAAAAKVGFAGCKISITATGCAEPMLSRILPPSF